MAAERKIKWFFKLILSFNIEQSRLRLPLKFVRSLNNEIPETAKLRTPDKRVWTMKVVQDGFHIWLEDGFAEFARYYSLQHGHQVYFRHNSKLSFSVRIFDKSSCEIPYPSSNPATKKLETAQQKPEHGKFMSDSSFPSPRHFSSKRPFFEFKLKSYNAKLSILYVPEQFAKRYMAKMQAEDIELKAGDGRQWKVNLKRKYTGRLSFGKGWSVFQEENKLKEGDVCIFELAKGKGAVFNVYMFVAL